MGNEETYSTSSDQYIGLSSPEIILPESYDISCEGMVGAISGDGWLLSFAGAVLSSVNFQGDAYGEPGSVVAIVNTLNSNGSPNPYVGDWFVIAQVVSTSPPTFLMRSPIPLGSYVVSIANGFIDDHYVDNTINIANKASVGISMPGNAFGTVIAGNTIIGGGSAAGTPRRRRSSSPPKAATPTGGLFPLPQYWTEALSFGVTIGVASSRIPPGECTSWSRTAPGNCLRAASTSSRPWNTTSSSGRRPGSQRGERRPIRQATNSTG